MCSGNINLLSEKNLERIVLTIKINFLTIDSVVEIGK